MITTTVPDRTEAAEYYFTYINQVPSGDICAILEEQIPETVALLGRIPEEQSLARYAADKWTIRQVVNHVNDAERLFVFRAMWFARGFDTELPSFDQDVAVSTAGADDRTLARHLEEFQAIRSASLTFFRGLPDEAWGRRGVASGHPFTVRALAFITAGHLRHHARILQERYIPALI